MPRAQTWHSHILAPLHGTAKVPVKEKVGLESGAGGQGCLCHHCHQPSMSLWRFWRQPEGSLMPLSVQSLGVRSEHKDQQSDSSSYLSKFPPESSQARHLWATKLPPANA